MPISYCIPGHKIHIPIFLILLNPTMASHRSRLWAISCLRQTWKPCFFTMSSYSLLLVMGMLFSSIFCCHIFASLFAFFFFFFRNCTITHPISNQWFVNQLGTCYLNFGSIFHTLILLTTKIIKNNWLTFCLSSHPAGLHRHISSLISATEAALIDQQLIELSSKWKSLCSCFQNIIW